MSSAIFLAWGRLKNHREQKHKFLLQSRILPHLSKLPNDSSSLTHVSILCSLGTLQKYLA